jgi:HD-GYP domain-containing protein (c-di-GMP phosphodiesterase class II)
MKTVAIELLSAGSISDAEYFNENGELLIGKGAVISISHLELLKQRNIFTLYRREAGAGNEIEDILSRELDEIRAFEFDEAVAKKVPPKPKIRLVQLSVPELHTIKKGQEGLTQLIRGKKASELDYAIEQGFFPDKPAGTPLQESMTQISIGDRTETYKDAIEKSYSSAVSEIQKIMVSLGTKEAVTGSLLLNVVNRFITTFVSDHNILLGLSGIKSTNLDYLFNHSLNVCLISLNIAAAAGFSEKQVAEIGTCALLHDIGMLLIPREIREKPGKLTPDEWFEVQKHPILGLHLLEKISQLSTFVPIVVYQSHERINGQGYPRQRNSRLIHAYAKIIHCADVFEALSSPRSYREPHSTYTAMATLIKFARQGVLDSKFVKSFLHYASLFPVGSIIELQDKRIGRVVAANKDAFAKPIVSILMDETGRRIDKGDIYQVDLLTSPKLAVARVFTPGQMEELGNTLGF